MSTELRPLWPWQRIPDWWVCAECGVRADGVYTHQGVAMFWCETHNLMLADILEDQMLIQPAGWYALRLNWKQLWHYRYLLRSRPSTRRRRAADAARESDALMEKLGLPLTPPTIIERHRGAQPHG